MAHFIDDITACCDKIKGTFSKAQSDKRRLGIETTIVDAMCSDVLPIIENIECLLPKNKPMSLEEMRLLGNDVRVLQHQCEDLHGENIYLAQRLKEGSVTINELRDKLNQKDTLFVTLRKHVNAEICRIQSAVGSENRSDLDTVINSMSYPFQFMDELNIEAEKLTLRHQDAMAAQEAQHQSLLQRHSLHYKRLIEAKEKELIQLQMDFRNTCRSLEVDFSQELHKLQAANAELKKKLDGARQEALAEAEAATAQRIVESNNAIRQRFEATVAQQARELETLRGLLDQSSSRFSVVEQELDEAMRSAERYKKMVNHLQMETSVYVSDIRLANTQKVRELETALQQVQAELERAQKLNEEGNSGMAAELSTVKKDNESLTFRLRKSTKDLETKEGQLREVNTLRINLQQQLAQSAKEVAALEEELLSQRQSVSDEVRVMELRGEVEQLRQQLKEANDAKEHSEEQLGRVQEESRDHEDELRRQLDALRVGTVSEPDGAATQRAAVAAEPKRSKPLSRTSSLRKPTPPKRRDSLANGKAAETARDLKKVAAAEEAERLAQTARGSKDQKGTHKTHDKKPAHQRSPSAVAFTLDSPVIAPVQPPVRPPSKEAGTNTEAPYQPAAQPLPVPAVAAPEVREFGVQVTLEPPQGMPPRPPSSTPAPLIVPTGSRPTPETPDYDDEVLQVMMRGGQPQSGTGTESVSPPVAETPGPLRPPSPSAIKNISITVPASDAERKTNALLRVDLAVQHYQLKEALTVLGPRGFGAELSTLIQLHEHRPCPVQQPQAVEQNGLLKLEFKHRQELLLMADDLLERNRADQQQTNLVHSRVIITSPTSKTAVAKPSMIAIAAASVRQPAAPHSDEEGDDTAPMGLSATPPASSTPGQATSANQLYVVPHQMLPARNVTVGSPTGGIRASVGFAGGFRRPQSAKLRRKKRPGSTSSAPEPRTARSVTPSASGNMFASVTRRPAPPSQPILPPTTTEGRFYTHGDSEVEAVEAKQRGFAIAGAHVSNEGRRPAHGGSRPGSATTQCQQPMTGGGSKMTPDGGIELRLVDDDTAAAAELPATARQPRRPAAGQPIPNLAVASISTAAQRGDEPDAQPLTFREVMAKRRAVTTTPRS